MNPSHRNHRLRPWVRKSRLACAFIRYRARRLLANAHWPKPPAAQNNGQGTPLVIGHRGAAGEAPENTMASFALALQQGADAIELDIHLSKDSRLIVCHDSTIDQTTDRSGAIADLTVEELKRADAGSWYSAEFAGERLPLLEEVFELVPDAVLVNVEIKSDSAELRKELLQMLYRYNRLDTVVVSSFQHALLMELKQAEPRVRIGLLYNASNALTPAEAWSRFGDAVYSLHPHHLLVDRAFAAEAAELGLRVFPWTVNADKRMKRLISFKVSGIITDYPKKLRNLVLH